MQIKLGPDYCSLLGSQIVVFPASTISLLGEMLGLMRTGIYPNVHIPITYIMASLWNNTDIYYILDLLNAWKCTDIRYKFFVFLETKSGKLHYIMYPSDILTQADYNAWFDSWLFIDYRGYSAWYRLRKWPELSFLNVLDLHLTSKEHFQMKDIESPLGAFCEKNMSVSPIICYP